MIEGIVNLGSQLRDSSHEERPTPLPRTPFPAGNRRLRGVGLSSLLSELSGCGRSAGRTRNHCFLRSDPAMVPEIRTRLCQTSEEETGSSGDTWYLDELFVRINGRQQYLWRAVDQDGDVIDILLQSHRDQPAAERFLRRLLRGQGKEPLRIITDKLKSYGAASRTILPGVTHHTQPYANNRAEVSHQPTRMRERQMRRFKSSRQAQRFLSLHGVVRNLFCVGRHLLRSAHHQLLRSRSFEVWRTATAA